MSLKSRTMLFPAKRAAGLTLAAVLLLGVLPRCARAQEAGATGPVRITADSVRREKRGVERDRTLAEDQRRQALELYDKALASLAREAALRNEVKRFERQRQNALRQVKALQAELDRPVPEPGIKLPGSATGEEIERALAQEQAELEARRQALRDLEKLSESQAARRIEIARQIGALFQQIEEIGDQLRSVAEAEATMQWKQAQRAELQARRQAVEQQIASLRAEQAALDAEAELTPLRRARAQRRVAESERRVELLEERSSEARRAERERSLERVRAECREALQEVPLLREVADETERLAAMLWGPEGVVMQVEKVTRQLTDTRKYNSQVQKIAQVTRRKFETVRLRGVATQWWPKIPADIPKPGSLRRDIRRHETLIPDVQHELIVLEEQRIEAGDIERQVAERVRRIQEIDTSMGKAELERRVRRLLTTRRELLDELIKRYTRYSEQLVELETAERNLLEDINALDNYILERVYWVRSVPGSIIPRPRDMAGAIGWLVSGGWGAVLAASFRGVGENPWPVASIAAFLLVLVVLLRPRCRGVLEESARQVADSATDSFRATLAAFGATVGLAALLPGVLLLLAAFLSPADAVELGRSISAALIYTAAIAGAFQLVFELMRPGGLAEAHFGWNSGMTAAVRRELRWLRAVFLPLIFVAIALGAEGRRFHARPELQAFNNSLGRVAFVLAMLAAGRFVYRVFRPGGEAMRASFPAGPAPGWGRVRNVWLPLLSVLTLVPAGLAAAGYYVTGFLLSYLLLCTLWWTLAFVLAGELLVRWRSLKHQSLAAQQAAERGGEGTASTVAGPDERAKIGEADAQVRRLFRSGLVLAWLLGLVMIWSEAVPPLQILKRVQVWPSVQLVETAETGAAETGVAGGQTAGETAAPVSPATQPAKAAGESTQATAASGMPSRLMLSDLMLALLVTIATLITAKNIPGLLEFTVLRRMRIEPGARTATSTLVRYFITIVGLSAAAALLGLTWQKIQWLAAALTFGLGFGLQEIFANFVSGLIILLDRPIRVGDVVTVGEVGGWVSKISIRATTITKWDRSELIVPNKEFITGKLVNWTLSNSLTRVELKVGVAYGTDVELVKRVLLEVAHAHPAVLADPAPYVVLMEFGDSAINFELRVYLNYSYGRLIIRDELHRAIVKAFAEHGIEIAFPQLDVHLRPDGPAELAQQGEKHPLPPAPPPGLRDEEDNDSN